MAKGTKNNRINPYFLFIAAAALMSAGFLMGPFPVLIFAGFAPLFAIVDHADGEHFLNKLELAGVALAIGLFAAHTFHLDELVSSILQAIALTAGFVAFAFTRKNLGSQLGKLPLIFFVLTCEYVFLKAGVGSSVVFLADALQFKTDWTRWTSVTGYVGISFWILAANLLLYISVLRGKLSVPFLLLFLLIVIAPIVYSYTLNSEVVDKQQMLEAYAGGNATAEYFKNGEWIPRTASWVSALILLFAFVKSYISKK